MDILGKVDCNHIVGDPEVRFMISTCPRCEGKGWYGSVHISSSGKLSTISGVTQLKQQIEKIITEDLRNSGYGLDNSVLEGVFEDNREDRIKYEVYRTLTYLKNVQVENRKSGFFYNPDEEIGAVERLTVAQDVNDPRIVRISVNVIALSKQKVEVNIKI